jgi:hypothetical protein
VRQMKRMLTAVYGTRIEALARDEHAQIRLI